MGRVVITGMGALTPIGNNSDDFWQSLINGVSGAAAITKFDAGKFKTQFACELKNFDPLDFIPKAEARKYDLFTQYALIAVEEAVKSGNINFDNLNKKIALVLSGVRGMEALVPFNNKQPNLCKETARPGSTPSLFLK